MNKLFILGMLTATVFGKKGGRPTIVNPTKPGKVIAVCGTSFCDSDMLLTNAKHGAWHVPNLMQLNSATAWVGNVVNGESIVTTTALGKSNVKYGGFCSKSQKTIYFMGSSVPVGIADPSWISKIPAQDIDILGNFVAGFSYKLDLTVNDMKAMNDASTYCQTTCMNTKGCVYGSYGWEAGTWFCKLYSKSICTDSTSMWWIPAAPGLPVNSVGGKLQTVAGIAGGCRVTDTIPKNTPYLNPGVSLAVSIITSYTISLPYTNIAEYTDVNGIVASVKCDVLEGGLVPSWLTYGTVWV